MVIFGAGASFDSVPVRDWSEDQAKSPFVPPPLADRLFEAREPFRLAVEAWWECAPLVGRLRNYVSRREPIESYLEQEVIRSEGDEMVLSQMLALRYYIKTIIEGCSGNWLGLCNGVTNYAVLLDTIDRWRRRKAEEERVVLVTFNYDLLLEDACIRSLRHRLAEMDDYISGSPYFVFKPHGSVSWSRLVRFDRDDPQPHAMIEYPKLVHLRSDFDVTSRIQSPQAAIPAIATPTRTKSDFECPPEHVQVFERMIPSVTRLLVVGWRGQEEHFLEKCQGLSEEAVGMVVSEDPAHASETALHLPDRVKIDVSAGNFSGFTGLAVQEEQLTEWLGG